MFAFLTLPTLIKYAPWIAAVAGAVALFAAWRIHEDQVVAGKVAVAVAKPTIAAGQAAAVTAAANIAVAADQRDQADQEVHIRNVQAIAAAPGADQAVDPAVMHAAIVGLCAHAAYAGDPRCAGLQPGHPAVVPQASAANAVAAR